MKKNKFKTLNSKLLTLNFSLLLMCGVGGGLLSCSGMLESNGTKDLFDKELTQKTDSMFMVYGIMQSMQLLADQYVVVGEVRGDLTSLNTQSSEHLQQLADFSANTSNKYDSAYVYYAVINNCNYYIAHRDTMLFTGSTNVVMDEYVAVKAFRAWAYLMLARIYGEVPFFTEPLTKISQVNSNSYPVLDMRELVEALTPDLEQYAGYAVPNYGQIDCGNTNFGQSKTAQSRLCFVPVDVILGEMYLETQQYHKAAQAYTRYIINNKLQTGNRLASFTTDWIQNDPPSDMYKVTGNSWSAFFAHNGTDDIITYIPMSVNRLRGTITRLPQLFGYNYYSTSSSSDSLYTGNAQIEASDVYQTLADSAVYYYPTDVLAGTIKSAKIGDMRRAATLYRRGGNDDSSKPMIRKFNFANVILFRGTTVYLHLAEALNRLGFSDIAFAILKDGIDRQLLSVTYLSDASKTALQTIYPFLSEENISIFDPTSGTLVSKSAYGIHKHGCGYTNGAQSPYKYADIVGARLHGTDTLKQDTINAMEEILCDEYAMEFAFEGMRFFDLCRLARHKNETMPGSGGQWLADKLSFKQPKVDLKEEENWYLPMK